MTCVRHLHLIDIESGHEAYALRSAAECWGARVTASWIGNSGQIVDDLSGRPGHDLIIICGHGEAGALLLPELHESVKHKYPYDGRITGEQFRDFVDLDNTSLLNLACYSGQEKLARTFLDCGANPYIAPVDAPDGNATLMFALGFLYEVLAKQQSIMQAAQTAANYDDDRAMFRSYSKP